MADLNTVLSRLGTNINLLGGEATKLHRTLDDAKKFGDPKLIANIQKQYSTTMTAYTKAKIKYRTIKAAVDAQESVPVNINVTKDTSTLTTITIAAIIASAIVASIVIYKKFFSQAAKACKDKKGTEKNNCMIKYKILGYEAAIKLLKSNLNTCSKTDNPGLCKAKIEYKISAYESKIKKQKNKLSESRNMIETVTESYLKFLYDSKYQISKTIRGSNIPIEHDNKVNWIRQCMMLESDKMKINCLRKLRDQVAMNPFYQYRIDRFVDAITQTYEPTDEQGTVPGNEFESPKDIGEV